MNKGPKIEWNVDHTTHPACGVCMTICFIGGFILGMLFVIWFRIGI